MRHFVLWVGRTFLNAGRSAVRSWLRSQSGSGSSLLCRGGGEGRGVARPGGGRARRLHGPHPVRLNYLSRFSVLKYQSQNRESELSSDHADSEGKTPTLGCVFRQFRTRRTGPCCEKGGAGMSKDVWTRKPRLGGIKDSPDFSV